MALQGTLEDFGIADIFQLIGQQQKTGMLVLTRKDNAVHIQFKEGHILSAEVQNRDHAERLGEMMLHAELITQDQLQSALTTQKKTLQRLGIILVENKSITKAQLDEFVALQTKETIFRLFRWNSGTYEFHQQDVAISSDGAQPVSAEHILMDGFRIIDEWPAIRKKIGSMETVYEKNPKKKLETAAVKDKDLDSELDQAFQAFDGEGDSSAQESSGLSPACMRVLNLVDGRRDIRKLIAVSRLGEFDACQGLATLLDQSWVQVTEAKPVEVQPESVKRVIDLYQDTDTQRGRFQGTFPDMIFYGGFVVALFLAFFYLGVGPFKTWIGQDENRIQGHTVQEAISDYQLQRIRLALDVYYLEKGYFPRALRELLEAQLLKSRDLSYPWTSEYNYYSDGSEFTLDKPFY